MNWEDKNRVFGRSYPGRISIYTELRERLKEDGLAVMETDLTFNGEEITLIATLILD